MVGWPKCSFPAELCLLMTFLYVSPPATKSSRNRRLELSSLFGQTYFQSDLILERSWFINGHHYAHSLEDWLKRLDKHAKEARKILENDAELKGLPKTEGRKMFYRWVCPTVWFTCYLLM